MCSVPVGGAMLLQCECVPEDAGTFRAERSSGWEIARSLRDERNDTQQPWTFDPRRQAQIRLTATQHLFSSVRGRLVVHNVLSKLWRSTTEPSMLWRDNDTCTPVMMRDNDRRSSEDKISSASLKGFGQARMSAKMPWSERGKICKAKCP